MSDHMDQWRRSVIRVGGGRGFVVCDDEDTRLVVTAAHCLPNIPQESPIEPNDCMFPDLIGPLGRAAPSIACEVLFVDPIADVAILGKPDGELWEQAQAYDALIGALEPVPLTARKLVRETFQMPTLGTFQGPASAQENGWLLSLSGEWFQCSLTINRGLWISEAAQPIVGGMSGSPIISRDGALGILCRSGGTQSEHHEGDPNPYLAAALPGWMAGNVRLL